MTIKEIKDIQVNENSLTRYVDWKTVHVLQAKVTAVPGWANVLIELDLSAGVYRENEWAASRSIDL